MRKEGLRTKPESLNYVLLSQRKSMIDLCLEHVLGAHAWNTWFSPQDFMRSFFSCRFLLRHAHGTKQKRHYLQSTPEYSV